MHCIVKLEIRNRTIYKILCKRKIAVIGAIANDRVVTLIADGKIGKLHIPYLITILYAHSIPYLCYDRHT